MYIQILGIKHTVRVKGNTGHPFQQSEIIVFKTVQSIRPKAVQISSLIIILLLNEFTFR